MEKPTQFELNDAIQRWRENVSKSPALRAEDRAELESHLRDSIKQLEAKGLSTEEAFLIARRRLGSSDALEVEFGKLNWKTIWAERAAWMIAGSLLIGCLSSLNSGLASLAGLLASGLALPRHTVGLFTAGTNLALFIITVPLTWRFLISGSRSLGTIAVRVREHPFLIAAAVAALTILSIALSMGFGFLRMYGAQYGAQDVGTLTLWQQASALFVQAMAWPVALAWVLQRMARKNKAAPSPTRRC